MDYGTAVLLALALPVALLPGCCSSVRPDLGEPVPRDYERVEAHLNHDGISHLYVLFVPACYRKDVPMPLMVSLHSHGCTNIDWTIESNKWYERVNPDRFLLVHPLGERGGWNSRSVSSGRDDLGFLIALVKQISAEYSVDRGRVWVYGTSNGAMMANKCAALAPDVFTAAATICGTLSEPLQAQLKPSRPVSLLAFHNMDDKVVPYSLQLPACTRWAQADGCDVGPITEKYSPKTSRMTWSRSNTNTQVVLYSTETGGHGLPADDIPWRDIVLTFFKTRDVAGGDGSPP